MIYINDKGYPYDKPGSLSLLFGILNIDASRGIAVAINNIIVPKKEWNDHLVKDNDKIILIKATQGG